MPEILFEDNSILVINKPAGLMVERDRHDNENVEARVEAYFDSKRVSQNTIIGIVHRLDRPVSGALIIAKKKSILVALNKQFEEGVVDKVYFAITEKMPEKPEAHLQHYLFKDVRNKKAVIYKNKRNNTVKCEMIYRQIDELKKGTLVEIHPLTGKYHQIRAQLSFIGCPIVGDEKYGAEKKYHPDAICLHSASVEFVHPVENKRIKVDCEYAKDWK